MAENLLEVENLKTYFFTRRGIMKAVDGVSFALNEGETLGLIGESACGKTVTCFSVIGLVPKPAGRIVSGHIRFKGEELLEKSGKEMAKIRGREISMILQDPMTSLNPVLSIGDQLTEPMRIHHKLTGKRLRKKAVDLLKRVGLPSPEVQLRNFPHQLSGGMRQRVVGATAISCQPKLLIADEPTTSLDMTIQAQYLSLLKEIQKQTNVAVLFVTHNFGIVAEICDKVAVMYAGRIVERATVRQLFNEPCHPYTIALMRSMPKINEKVEWLEGIEGQPPSLHDLPLGCSYLPRCSVMDERCRPGFPSETPLGDEHWVSCWHYA